MRRTSKQAKPLAVARWVVRISDSAECVRRRKLEFGFRFRNNVQHPNSRNNNRSPHASNHHHCCLDGAITVARAGRIPARKVRSRRCKEVARLTATTALVVLATDTLVLRILRPGLYICCYLKLATGSSSNGRPAWPTKTIALPDMVSQVPYFFGEPAIADEPRVVTVPFGLCTAW